MCVCVVISAREIGIAIRLRIPFFATRCFLRVDCAFRDISIDAFLLLIVPQMKVWTLLNGHMAFVAVQKPFAFLRVWKEFDGVVWTNRECCIRIRRIAGYDTLSTFRRLTFSRSAIPMKIDRTIHWHRIAVVANVISICRERISYHNWSQCIQLKWVPLTANNQCCWI